MSYIHRDFLLQTRTARRPYHDYAEAAPILDYHCHLPPKDIAEIRPLKGPVFEITDGSSIILERLQLAAPTELLLRVCGPNAQGIRIRQIDLKKVARVVEWGADAKADAAEIEARLRAYP